jgi:hypothetical protein
MAPGSAFVARCLALKTRKKGNVDFQCLMFIFTRGKAVVNCQWEVVMAPTPGK